VTIPIVILTSIISILAFYNDDWKAKSMFSPYIIKHRNEWHRFITHAFVHADWLHLFFNMYVLYTFGQLLENNYEMVFGERGKLYYILLYVLGIVMSAIPGYEKHKNNSWYHAVGASGAVSAVVFAAILFNPTMKMGIIFLPIMMPAFVFGLLYLGYSYYMSHRGGDNIAHDAHFFGALFGIMFTILLEMEVGRQFLRQVSEYFGN
jgi:membrane associated rhomboid family serine protease